jgi:hypothetical protein
VHLDAQPPERERRASDYHRVKARRSAADDSSEHRDGIHGIANHVAVVHDEQCVLAMHEISGGRRELSGPRTLDLVPCHLSGKPGRDVLESGHEVVEHSGRRSMPLVEAEPCDGAVESSSRLNDCGRLARSGGRDDLHERVTADAPDELVDDAGPGDDVVCDARRVMLVSDRGNDRLPGIWSSHARSMGVAVATPKILSAPTAE